MPGLIPTGVYRIKNPMSGTYMTCSAEQEGVVHGWQSDADNDYQKWELQPTGESYHIRNLGNARFLSKISNVNGTQVQATTDPTKWTLPRLDGGVFRIEADGRDVDIDCGRIENGTRINTNPRSEATEQMWRFKPVGAQPLADVRQSLEDTRQRLAAAEERANHQQSELVSVKKSLSVVRSQITAAERTATEIRERLSVIEASVKTNGIQLSELVDHQVPTIATKAAGLVESFAQADGQLTAMRKTIGVAGDRLDRLNRNNMALQATTDMIQTSFGQSQDRLSTLEGIVDRLGGQHEPTLRQTADDVTPTQKSFSPKYATSDQGLPALQSSLVTIRQQVNGLDKRVPALEARADKLQGTFVQTQEYLSSVGDFLRAMERKMPSIETKAGRLKILQGQIREEIAAVRIFQSTLDSRTQNIESRVEKLAETLADIQDSGGDDPWPTFPAKFDVQLDSS